MPIVGLDLGSHSFRAVELEKKKDRIILQKYGSYTNPKINLSSSDPKDLSSYADALRQFFAESNFSTSEVILSLPESEVFTRVVKLPKMSEKELKSSIEYEAEQYIPIPLKETKFDFQLLDQDVTEKDKMNVLIVASKNTILEKYIKVLREAGLTPKAMEPETLSIARVLSASSATPNASIILNLGYKNSQIIVSYKGHVRFTRSVSIGGDNLTKVLEQQLGFDYSQAEEYKKTYGLDARQAEGKVYEALKPVFDKILEEVRRSKIFYTSHNPGVIINRLIVSGGSALMPGLLLHIANNLDLEAELANPWRNIQLSKALETQKEALVEQGPLFVTSVGLGLKEYK